MADTLRRRSAAALRRECEEQVHRLGFGRVGDIPNDVGFREWCEALGKRGLKVDRKPFRLDNRPALAPVYDAIPTTRDEARKQMLVIQKATQLGLTVWEVLADVYMAKKFSPINIGMYLPSKDMASGKSSHRFMPIVRSAPEIYYELTHRVMATGASTFIGEGNVLTRELAGSLLLFLWTTGKVTTESWPLDIISLDEVQEMTLTQIDKVLARLGDSEIGYKLMLSTANMPDLDINFWYKLGNQEVWHTECHNCGVFSDMSEPNGIFPNKSTAYNRGEYLTAPTGEFLWVCPACQCHIPDLQKGAYIAQNLDENRDTWIRSMMLPRTISPMITATGMVTDFNRAVGGDRKKSFYNRQLARPYVDPDQIPVSLSHCAACVADGLKAGLVWEKEGKDTYMGIDQMGGFNCVIIKRRLPDGRQAVVHCEIVTAIEPFDRCGELMRHYGVSVCVVEQLPNFNSARAFSSKFPGRVFLATAYTDLANDTMQWGDDLTKSDRRTDESERNRYTVVINRYKGMQNALFRVRDRACLFPDPSLLEQDVDLNGKVVRSPIVTDHVFPHLTMIALMVEQTTHALKSGALERRAVVRKIGRIDPHFAFANMLCDVAWARNHGTGIMILPQAPGAPASAESDAGQRAAAAMPGLPQSVIAMIDAGTVDGTCGACFSFKEGRCTERGLRVAPRDPGCELYAPPSDG